MYEKYNWVTGEVITKDKLNHIEDGIGNSLDIDTSNISNLGKSNLSNLGMPSDRYIDLTLGASGSSYTAPANGYFQLAVLAGTLIQLYNKTKAEFWKASTSTGQAFSETIVCQAGDRIECYYNYTEFRWFRFYYAEGSKEK